MYIIILKEITKEELIERPHKNSLEERENGRRWLDLIKAISNFITPVLLLCKFRLSCSFASLTGFI